MTPLRIKQFQAAAGKNIGGMTSVLTITPRDLYELCALALGRPVAEGAEVQRIVLSFAGEGLASTPELTQKIESFARGLSNPLRYVRPTRYDYADSEINVSIVVDKPNDAT